MQQILLGLQILLALSIIVLVMIQQGRGADAGASFGGGSSGSLFGSRGPASFLARATGVLAAVFFANSFGLAYLAKERVRGESVMDRIEAPVESNTSSDSSVPSAPANVPVVPGASDTSTGDVPVPPKPQ